MYSSYLRRCVVRSVLPKLMVIASSRPSLPRIGSIVVLYSFIDVCSATPYPLGSALALARPGFTFLRRFVFTFFGLDVLTLFFLPIRSTTSFAISSIVIVVIVVVIALVVVLSSFSLLGLFSCISSAGFTAFFDANGQTLCAQGSEQRATGSHARKLLGSVDLECVGFDSGSNFVLGRGQHLKRVNLDEAKQQFVLSRTSARQVWKDEKGASNAVLVIGDTW